MKLIYTLLFLCALSASAQSWELNYSTETTSEEVKALSAPNDKICWFVTNFDNLYKTSDGGNNWIKLPPGDTAFNPSGIFVIDQDTAFKSSSSSLYKTIDGGSSWTLVFTGEASFPPVVTMKNEAEGILVSNGFLYKTTDGGNSWSTATITQPPAAVLNTAGKGNIDALGNDVWVTQENVGIVYSPDYGKTWSTPTNSGFVSFGTNAHISFVDPDHGIAMEAGSSPYIYVTTDGGNTWQSTDDSQGHNQDVLAYESELWYIPNPADNFYIKHSSNGGSTWDKDIQLEGNHGFNLLEKGRVGVMLWAGTNQGKIYKYNTLSLSNEDFATTSTMVYPNPASGQLHFNIPNIKQVNLYNMLGEKVLSRNMSAQPQNLDVSSLPTGTYITQITTDDDRVQNTKVVVNR